MCKFLTLLIVRFPCILTQWHIIMRGVWVSIKVSLYTFEYRESLDQLTTPAQAYTIQTMRGGSTISTPNLVHFAKKKNAPLTQTDIVCAWCSHTPSALQNGPTHVLHMRQHPCFHTQHIPYTCWLPLLFFHHDYRHRRLAADELNGIVKNNNGCCIHAKNTALRTVSTRCWRWCQNRGSARCVCVLTHKKTLADISPAAIEPHSADAVQWTAA